MWCVDHLWFYGEPEFGIGDGQFGQCNFTATWSDKELVWRDEQFGWTDTYHDHSRIDCHIGDIKGLQSISYKVCSEDYVPASHSNFYARFENGNGGQKEVIFVSIRVIIIFNIILSQTNMAI